MRIRVLQVLSVLVLFLGIVGTPALGRGFAETVHEASLQDCATSGQNTCGGG